MRPLEDYDVSPLTGFLPEQLPLQRLPEYFQPWEQIIDQLPALILTKRLRQFVEAMPLLDVSQLDGDERQWRRACSILGFMAHAYVWQRPTPIEKLPKQLAEPWIEVSAHFDLPPIGSYAGLVLWNFRTVLPTEEWDLETLATLTTYTGSLDESWFYLVSVAIEKYGGPCVALGLDIMKACEDDDVSKVVTGLQHLAETIDSLSGILMRMYEMCDPHVFYFRLRPFLAGWKNMAEAGLPSGVWYGDEQTPRQYSGGSNAQSSLIQLLDILLSVEHHALGERKPPGMSSLETPVSITPRQDVYLYQMRQYMPLKHREFLEDLESEVDIRGYVVDNAKEHPGLITAYDACLACLRSFRSKHIQVVMRYISLPARNAARSDAHGLARGKGDVGTGGTALMPFLKQARDETGDVAAGDWGRRLLTTIQPASAKKDDTEPGHW